MERKLAAIFCADVFGYSRLMGEDEEATLRTLTSHRKLIGSQIDQHHGRFVNSAGDSVLAEFASVVEAVNCAVDIQATLKAQNLNLPADRRMEFRIGVNLGDVIVEGEQIYGDGVNIAARLESLAHPGGICISNTVHDQVSGKLALTYEDLGEQAVKNIAKPVRAFRVLSEGTPAALKKAKRPQRGYRRGGLLSLTVLAIFVGAFILVQHISFRPPRTHASIPSQEKPALPLPSIPSIAVLPFTNLSGNPGQEYFSDGLTDYLITKLSRVPGVLVIARNSTFLYKSKSASLQQVGRELGVRTVLEGSVLKAGKRLRVDVQLADAATGTNLWAQSFDQPLQDIFTVQDDIVHKIVTTLSSLFKLDDLKVPRSFSFEDKPTDNIEAFDYTLRGGQSFWRMTKNGNEQARQMYEKAIELDPNYADAYAALGWAYSVAVLLQWSANPQADLKRASELGRRALALDDSNILALTLLSRDDWMEQQFDQAVVDAKRAIAINPNFPIGYLVLAQALFAEGNPEDQIVAIQKAIRLDPGSQNFYAEELGGAYLKMERYQQAVFYFKRYLSSFPNDLGGHVWLSVAYTELGRNHEARVQAVDVLRLNPQYRLPPPGAPGILGVKTSPLTKRWDADLRKAGLK